MTKHKDIAFDEDYQSILVVALNVAYTSKGSFLPQLLARHIRKNLAIIPEVLQMTRELKRMDNMPKVFFVLECASSDADNFEMMLTFEATIRAEEDRIEQKKKKLLADIKEGEKAMREDDSYSDFFLFLLTSEMMEMERRKKSIQRKKRKEAIPDDVKKGVKQLREWNRIARKKEKLSQQQK